MFYTMLNKQIDEESDEDDNAGINILNNEQKANRLSSSKGILKNKIKFISKMLKMQRVLREERENILRIKALNNNKLPQGILLEGKEAMEAFTAFKKADSINEKRPY